MGLFDKMVQARLDEYAAELAEYYKAEDEYIKTTKTELLRRLEKSREYRIMLRDYQQELKAREQALDQREQTMRDELMAEVLAKEQTLSNREKDLLKEVGEKEARVEARIKEQTDYNIALRRTERTLLDWFKRVDRKEDAAFREILADVERFKQYMDAIPQMDGFQFEEYVAGLLIGNGFSEVIVTQKSQDYGADVTAEKQGIRYVIQCKYYTSQVGIEAVQQIYAAKIHYDAHVAIVATNSVYSRAAKTLAAELNVVLWDGGDLDKMKKSEG